MANEDKYLQRRVLLLESEVAERLRCSTRTIKRLRLSGKLAHVPGRPVLIDEADLNAYIDSIRVARFSVASGTTGAAGAEKKRPEDAAARARRKWLLRKARAKEAE